MLDSGAEKRAVCAVTSPALNANGSTELQNMSLQCISNRAIIGLRQRRYLRQGNLDYSTLVLRIPTHRLDKLLAVWK
jgi:hypothetical protein